MSVDKFGRHSDHVKTKGTRGPPGAGFKLTSDGNYDIDTKLLCNVQDANVDGDAVNLGTLKRKLNGCLKLSSKPLPTREWNAENIVITNVGKPVGPADAVNVKWFKENSLESTTNGWNCKKKRLADVGDPRNGQDAVNKQTLDKSLKKCLKISDKAPAVYDAINNIITNVGDPKGESDVVNKRTLDDRVPWLGDTGDVYDFASHRVAGIAHAIYADDAVTKSYLELHSVYTKNGLLECTGKRLSNVEDPVQDQDAVTKKFLKGNTPLRDDRRKVYSFHEYELKDIAYPKGKNEGDAVNIKYLKDNVPHLLDGGGITFGNQIAKNLGDPTRLTDAVNVNYLVRLLSAMFFNFYNDLANGKGKVITYDRKDKWINDEIVTKYFIREDVGGSKLREVFRGDGSDSN